MNRIYRSGPRTLRLFSLFTAISISLGFLAFGAPDREKWFSLSLAGQRVGYLHETSIAPEAGAPAGVETRVEMKLTFNRLGNKVEMETRSTTHEDSTGHLLSIVSEIKLSAQVIRTEGIVGGREIRLTTSTGGAPHSRTIAFEGALLGPQGIRDLTRSRLAGAGDTVGYQSFSAEMGQVVKGERTVLGREPVEGSNGRPALKIQESLSGIPMKRTIWLDESGDEIQTSDPSPFGDIVGVPVEKEEALREAGSGQLPEEQYQSSLARSNVRLPRAREIDSITIKVRHLKPELGWPEFSGPYQSVLARTADEITLRIDRPALPRKGPAQSSGPEDIEPNAYLDTDDPLIRETALKVAVAIVDPFARAVRLRDWVGENMTFDLGIVSPPAREVIRNRRGTCVGYAMLLTSLARASGIPARFLMGYVYLNGIWGGHAWTEIFIDGSWVPLDSAIMGPGIADAARFYFTRSNLAAGMGEASIGGSQVYGAVKIEVIEYRLAGRSVRIPSGQKLYEVTGDLYRNPGLGLSVSKPDGFAFTDLDKTWPEDTLLKMSGPGGAAFEIRQDNLRPGLEPGDQVFRLLEEAVGKGARSEGRILERGSYRVTAGRKAGTAFCDGTDIWILVAEGPKPEALLESVSATLSLN